MQEPWEIPLDEEVWQVLMEQGEIAPEIAPPPAVRAGSPPVDNNRMPASAPPMPAQAVPVSEAWDLAYACLNRQETCELQVVGYNRGGLLVEWRNLQGFVPASHLVDMPRNLGPAARLAALSDRVGQSLVLQMIEVDPAQNRLVFSERAAQNSAASPEATLRSLRPGDVRRGRVTNLTSFGAFVDLGSLEGLIHISEISWQRVNHPADELVPGQVLDVYVLGVDPAQRRVALSLKHLRPDPWLVVEDRYRPGDIVEGVVTNVVSFGAFTRLEEGLEGLIHVSELAEGDFLHPRNVVREGDAVMVQVLNVDSQNRRLALSLRRAPAARLAGDGRARSP